MKYLIVATALLSGCMDNGCRNTLASDDDAPPTSVNEKVYYLCVGMEYSARFGSCPGCEKDANKMSRLLSSKYGYAGDTIISGQAKKSEVVKRLKAGVERTKEDGLFIFCYSGHGGQEYIGGSEPDGSDRQDEYLCLYDTYMLDDEIWDIVSKCKGRVFLYFDACHSATMYRSIKAHQLLGPSQEDIRDGVPVEKMKAVAMTVDSDEMVSSKGFTFRPEKFVTAQAMDADGSKSTPRILCWSGCKESEYSYGGSNGGTMTLAVIGNWAQGVSYDVLWEKVRSDVNRMQKGQNPVSTYIGEFPMGMEAFK